MSITQPTGPANVPAPSTVKWRPSAHHDGIWGWRATLDGVDNYPALLAELAHRGWSDADLARVAGENLLRAMEQAEAVSAGLRAACQPSSAALESLIRTCSEATVINTFTV